MLINIQNLEGFYWVAREGGYAAAARAFPRSITQPAVYQQVRRLEAELEVELVERVGHRKLRLTPAGDELYAFCRPFFEGLPDALRSLRREAERRRMRIDAAGVVVRQLLPPWIRRIRRKRKDLKIELREIEAPDFERLRRGEADVLIDFLPEIPDDMRMCEVAVAHPFIVVPRDHPLAKSEALDLTLLRDTPFVSYHPTLHQHALQMAALRDHIGLPEEIIAASSVDVILSFVAAGLGYSLVPWLDERGPRRAGLVALTPRGHDRRYPIVAAWLGGSPMAATTAALMALVAEG